MKIIPAIDLMDGQVVRLYKGDPKTKQYTVMILCLLPNNGKMHGKMTCSIVDLDATIGTGSNLVLIEKISKELSIPVEVAGGLRDEQTIDKSNVFCNKDCNWNSRIQRQRIITKNCSQIRI